MGVTPPHSSLSHPLGGAVPRIDDCAALSLRETGDTGSCHLWPWLLGLPCRSRVEDLAPPTPTCHGSLDLVTGLSGTEGQCQSSRQNSAKALPCGRYQLMSVIVTPF